MQVISSFTAPQDDRAPFHYRGVVYLDDGGCRLTIEPSGVAAKTWCPPPQRGTTLAVLGRWVEGLEREEAWRATPVDFRQAMLAAARGAVRAAAGLDPNGSRPPASERASRE